MTYSSPLSQRYASPAMQALWGDRRRIGLWRRLWLALLEIQRELGLDIPERAVAELRGHLDDADLERAAEHEKRIRHDVMAHVHHLGEQAPAARPFIHLGATSAYVTDNADLILMREGLQLLLGRVAAVLVALAKPARRYRDVPCLAYTHFQPAQLTTVGKRITLWMQELLLDAEELLHRLGTLQFRGVKGTTGTQASFLELFDGDDDKVRELDARVAAQMGFTRVFPITGQTYPRKQDAQVLAALAGVAQSAAKFATDLRLLQHEGEMLEPFESDQVGSSAMAYKRNPMRAERMTGLARFVIELGGNAWHTAAEQWLERTLDDSANRRLVIPEAFLACDAILVLATNVAAGLEVREPVIASADARREGRGRPPAAARGDPDAQPGRGPGDGRAGRAERCAGPARARPRVQGPEARGAADRAAAGDLHRPRGPPGGRVPCARRPRRASPHRGRGTCRGRCRGQRMTTPLVASALPLPLLRRGKVREVYEVDRDTLLLVASDRVSAFDVVLREPVPHKGAVLTQLSAFWFQRLAHVVSSHFLSADADEIVARVPELTDHRSALTGRAMLVRRTTPLAFECVVRGYITGSAWAEYRTSGTLAGEPLAAGLVESARLDPPIFSPATKADVGHDENVTFDNVAAALGRALAEQLKSASLALYEGGRGHAAPRGIIIADTKFEFGTASNGRLLVIDEILTPDSSRFWPADRYAPGRSQPSFDKQPLRDYLAGLKQEGKWDGDAPPPPLPPAVVQATSERYLKAYELITGKALETT